jgi:hypothetical protein
MSDVENEYYSPGDDRADEPPYRPITPITPFSALPDSDEVAAIRVIGIRPSADDPDVFEFIVIKQAVDGEAWVATVDTVSCDRVEQGVSPRLRAPKERKMKDEVETFNSKPITLIEPFNARLPQEEKGISHVRVIGITPDPYQQNSYNFVALKYDARGYCAAYVIDGAVKPIDALPAEAITG